MSKFQPVFQCGAVALAPLILVCAATAQDREALPSSASSHEASEAVPASKSASAVDASESESDQTGESDENGKDERGASDGDDDPFGALMDELRRRKGGADEATGGGSSPQARTDAGAEGAEEGSVGHKTTSLFCEGELAVQSSVLPLPSSIFEFSANLDLAKNLLSVTKISEGDLFEEGEDYEVTSASPRRVVVAAEYQDKFFRVDEVEIDLRDFSMSGEGELDGDYQPRLVQPRVVLSGECSLSDGQDI